MFDVNFNFGEESVFVTIDQPMAPPFPPPEGYFLELNGGDFLLLNGQNLDLL